VSVTLSTGTAYGLYACEADECDGDGFPWAAEMPRDLEDDYQPSCACCGGSASLLTPLAPLA
jgi:hypothetical protein